MTKQGRIRPLRPMRPFGVKRPKRPTQPELSLVPPKPPKVPPVAMRPAPAIPQRSIEDALRQAREGPYIVTLVYTDVQGQSSARAVEPYEVRNGGVFAYDLDAHGIRRFLFRRISAVTVSGEQFQPRWPVKIR